MNQKVSNIGLDQTQYAIECETIKENGILILRSPHLIRIPDCFGCKRVTTDYMVVRICNDSFDYS